MFGRQDCFLNVLLCILSCAVCLSSAAEMNFTAMQGNLTGLTASPFIPRLMTNMVVLLVGVAVCFVNATMVHTFNKHQILGQNPRYILFTHLVVNEMIQLISSISLYIIAFAFSTVLVSLCAFLLLPAILATRNTPLNLACMATECYFSVSFPLRYNAMCTVKRTKIVIGVIWATSVLSILPDVFVLFITEDPKFLTSRALCDRDTVYRSSYSLNKSDAVFILFLVVVCLTLFYTYFRILCVAQAAKADVSKARWTILLHGFQVLLCAMVYVQSLLTKSLLNSFPQGLVPIRLTSFVVIQIIPRFLSPIVYGLRDKTFRKYLKKYWICLQATAVQR